MTLQAEGGEQERRPRAGSGSRSDGRARAERCPRQSGCVSGGSSGSPSKGGLGARSHADGRAIALEGPRGAALAGRGADTDPARALAQRRPATSPASEEAGSHGVPGRAPRTEHTRPGRGVLAIASDTPGALQTLPRHRLCPPTRCHTGSPGPTGAAEPSAHPGAERCQTASHPGLHQPEHRLTRAASRRSKIKFYGGFLSSKGFCPSSKHTWEDSRHREFGAGLVFHCRIHLPAVPFSVAFNHLWVLITPRRITSSRISRRSSPGCLSPCPLGRR